jgi:uncharacterized glyoxalase superfamily metalloenzyme YdcJ
MSPTTPAASSPTTARPTAGRLGGSAFADKIAMQHKLFHELSRMFADEVPMYDKSLLCNHVVNRAVCDLLSQLHIGFGISDEQLDKTSGERHGAIRIGRPDEYRWIGRFFAQFAMEPHNFYDMTAVGAKSQPIIATAFRSTLNPEHRVFTSLLQPNYYEDSVRTRIEEVLSHRQVFSDRAKQLIEQGERDGGLAWADAEALIKEATTRIFKWTGKARDYQLYKDLCDAGFKIAADIACFERHHLNHLTPNTFCMDLYTAAMKFCMGELTIDAFKLRATRALTRLTAFADRDYMHLTFKHLSYDTIDSFKKGTLTPDAPSVITGAVDALTKRLQSDDLALTKLKHSGFKDFTEGPSEDTPILLRQDAYKALTEPVTFTNPDGSTTQATHTARFGEIEQRFFACTPMGRDLYDTCLAQADAARDKDPKIVSRDFAAYEALYAAPFSPFPKTVPELLKGGFIFAKYAPTAKGLAAKGTGGSITTTDIQSMMSALVAAGHASYEALRYEDFLPVSAAGIFASNLNQYGTKSTAHVKPTYKQSDLEAVLGKPIIDASAVYAAIHARSILTTLDALGVGSQLPAPQRRELEATASKWA